MDGIKRLRMFAGPNGSGKSSLIRDLSKDFSPNGLIHTYTLINADEILKALRSDQGVALECVSERVDEHDLMDRIRTNGRLAADHRFFRTAKVEHGHLFAPAECCDAYVAASIADVMRESLLLRGDSFTFETVMSHVSKVEFFTRARELGYQTYLYFIATDSAEINLFRVKGRAAEGEHDVPEEKVYERYERSLTFVNAAVERSYRAFFFDNSETVPVFLGERTPDRKWELQMERSRLPGWFLSHVRID